MDASELVSPFTMQKSSPKAMPLTWMISLHYLNG